ncbi:MAG: chemotaxis protein CheW [Devosia sp.]|uniref:chemotaxis protein CheW n=1 Tax=Devosia sp. TaxID=1871048 RepID=UPI00339142A3
MVGGRSYVLSGGSVVEVLRRPRVTRVPHGPSALLGVSNLRGTVLPIVSLARLMGAEASDEDRLVVVDQGGPVGLLVDAVLGLDVGNSSDTQQVEVASLLQTVFKPQTTQSLARQTQRDVAPVATVAETAQRVLVSFQISEQTFALPLGAITEVLRVPASISRVAGSDQAVLGVANVRDRSLPIISLGAILGFSGANGLTSGNRIMVVEHNGAQVGLVADAVETILRLDESSIDEVPPILQRGQGNAELDAIGRQGSGRPLVTILSVPRLFANAAVEETMGAMSGETTNMVDHRTTQAQEQFVVFDLGAERYGLPIASVQEVLRLPDTVTRIPNGPRFVSGIINLRGRPVPIIDQRQRFEAPLAADAVQPRVIIVTVGGLQAGFIVDAVSEVLSVDVADLAKTPSLSSERSAVFNRVANVGEEGSLILLIDPEELLSRAEQDVISEIAAGQQAANQA